MNKKDCMNIGYILADNSAPQRVLDAFFELDPRIKDEYEGYNAVNERTDAVTDRFEAIMRERYGNNWALLKESRLDSKGIMEQARKEIYGDEYHPSLFRR